MGWIFGISLSETCNKVVFKSLDGYFYGIPAMDMRGNKVVGDISLKEGIIEEIISFIIYYMETGIVSRCLSVSRSFWTPLLMHRASAKIALLS